MPKGTKEEALIIQARSHVANTVSALEKKDLAGARQAWFAYDPTWNGMEVYVSFRSQPKYHDLEMNWQAKITEAFKSPTAKVEELLPMAKTMLASWNEALQIAQEGPAISPIFDEVADIRINRQPLRKATFDLAAGNVAGAKEAFATFAKTWPKIGPVLRKRSMDCYLETEIAIKIASAGFAKPNATAAELTPLIASVNSRYGLGQNLATTAARKADLTKTTVPEADINAAGVVRTIQMLLKGSMLAWTGTNYKDAGTHAQRTLTVHFVSPLLAGPLKAKQLDANLKKALEEFAPLAGAAGDKAKVLAANKAAVEAGEIAIQGLLGQFWADPTLIPLINAAAPKEGLVGNATNRLVGAG